MAADGSEHAQFAAVPGIAGGHVSEATRGEIPEATPGPPGPPNTLRRYQSLSPSWFAVDENVCV
jgi:hypothetical protein